MPTDSPSEVKFEIGHVLFVDIVGYSKLLISEQSEQIQELKQIVRATEQFRLAEAEGKLLRLPTGDGGALVFRTSPETPVLCALEICKELKNYPELHVRMGIHSGPVNEVTDLNEQANIAGAGINIAQRIMDCGDAGHILLSKHVAEDLEHYARWRPYLHDLGQSEVKHGVRIGIVNFCGDQFGNPGLPEKIAAHRREEMTTSQFEEKRSSRKRRALAVTFLALTAAAITVSIIAYRMSRQLSHEQLVRKAASLIPEKSIAVLPFENLSDEKQNEHLPDGVQDEILTDLARVADLKVISRTSVKQYKSGQQRNVREIAKQLGVAHILEGTVQTAANRVRVSVQLIDARTDNHLWAEHFDRDLADVFAVESEVAEKIVAQLQSKLSPQEKATIELQPTADMTAYDVYLRARDLIDGAVFTSGKELFDAIELLEQAIKRDPSFALAYYELAHANDQLYLRAIDHTTERLKLAEAAIESLRRLRPHSGEAHLAQAKHLYWGYLDYDGARKELATARSALPNDRVVFLLAGYIDRRQGRWGESLENLQQAIVLDPRGPQTPFMLEQLSRTYQLLHRYVDARATLDRGLALTPNNANLRVSRAFLDFAAQADIRPAKDVLQSVVSDKLEAAQFASPSFDLARYQRNWDEATRALSVMPPDGCREEAFPFPPGWCEGILARSRGDAEHARSAFSAAHTEVDTIIQQQPDNAQALCVLGLIDAALGNERKGIQEAKRAAELLPVTKDAVDGARVIKYLALTYAFSGDKDAAIAELAKAAKNPGYLSYGELRLDPNWDPLRGDPRFEKIVESLAPKPEPKK